MKIGMACGSNDITLMPFFKRLYTDGLLDFLELHIKPNIMVKQVQAWKRFGLVKYVHPENGGRGNFVQDFMDIALDVMAISSWKKIVFDPGIVGECLETDAPIPDVSAIFLPENMPYKTSLGDVCVNFMPSEMPRRFTFDVSHAWITATQLNLDHKKLIKDFIDMKPSHFHITDCRGTMDHMILGMGDIDWSYVVPLMPEHITVTIETDNLLKGRKENIIKDLKFFRGVCESYRSG